MTKRRAYGHWSDEGVRRRPNPFRDLSASVLHNYEMELRALIGSADRERARLIQLRDLVAEVLQERDGPDVTVIADHAIVRWLERYEGFDVGRVEAEITAMLDRGAPEVAVREGVVITVLPPGTEARNDEG